MRSDDAVGLEVARRLRATLLDGVEVLEREGEPTSLLAAWEGADAVWLVDAVLSGAAPGPTMFQPSANWRGPGASAGLPSGAPASDQAPSVAMSVAPSDMSLL